MTTYSGYRLKEDEIDEFVTILSRQPKLAQIQLDGVKLADAHVQQLLSLPLKTLWLTECSLGGTLRCKAPETLEKMALFRTRLDDHSLSALGQMPRLTYLDITRTRVSDRSIEYLASLESLDELVIRRCKITQAGVERLKQLRPNLHVAWEPL